MDLDGDGYLSMYELEYFYEEQLHRIEEFGIETLPFEDCLCQMLDMIRPKVYGKISLSDMKNCKMTSVFFDTFFNLAKFLDHEQRDPFASRNHGLDGEEVMYFIILLSGVIKLRMHKCITISKKVFLYVLF